MMLNLNSLKRSVPLWLKEFPLSAFYSAHIEQHFPRLGAIFDLVYNNVLGELPEEIHADRHDLNAKTKRLYKYLVGAATADQLLMTLQWDNILPV